MSGQAWNAAWYGWFDGSEPLSFGAGVSSPAFFRTATHFCISASSNRAWSGPYPPPASAPFRIDVSGFALLVANAATDTVSVKRSFGRYDVSSSITSGQPSLLAPTRSTVSAPADLKRWAMTLVFDLPADASSAGASFRPTATGVIPSSFSAGTTCLLIRSASLVAPYTATLPSRSPALARVLATVTGRSVSACQVIQGAFARS